MQAQRAKTMTMTMRTVAVRELTENPHDSAHSHRRSHTQISSRTRSAEPDVASAGAGASVCAMILLPHISPNTDVSPAV